MLLVFGAALVLSYATYLIGPRAALPAGVALLTALTIFALARLRLFKQRNGSFLALGIVSLLGVCVPLVEYALTRGRDVQPVAVQPDRGAAERSSSAPAASSDAQSLKEAFNLPTPASEEFAFRVRQDLRVDINGKKYVIKEGDVFTVSEMTGEDVRFTAAGEQIALPLNMVEMLGSPEPGETASTPPSPATPGNEVPTPPSANPANVAATPQKKGPVNVTEEAQREAIRRYPAIGVRNSKENQLFVDSYQELKMSGADDFFANPQWPLSLAEMLAKRHGWGQPGQPSTPAASTTVGEDPISGLPEEPRPKRRPVAEELDEMEPEADSPEPPNAGPQAEVPPLGESASDLPAE